MKNVIKLLALSLAMIFVLACFPACGSGDKYIIATDTTFAPFEFVDENGKYIGIDIELFTAIAEDQNIEFEFHHLGFNAALTALESGAADGVIAGMSINEKRKETYTFSDPYYESGVVMAIAADNNDVKGYSDLKDKVVAVKNNTEGQTFANSIKDTYGFEVEVYKDSNTMYLAVKNGNAVACFEDYPVMGYGISKGNGLKMVTDKELPSNYGFAVLKGAGNDELVEKFNAGLKNLKESGKYQEILDKYIKTN